MSRNDLRCMGATSKAYQTVRFVRVRAEVSDQRLRELNLTDTNREIEQGLTILSQGNTRNAARKVFKRIKSDVAFAGPLRTREAHFTSAPRATACLMKSTWPPAAAPNRMGTAWGQECLCSRAC